MPTNVKRRLLTDMLLDRLAPLSTGGADHVSVGDHEAPADGGWPDEEGIGTFVNYIVLTALATAEPVGGMGQPHTITAFPYALTSIGVSRRGAEHTADRARGALVGLVKQDTSDGLRVQYVQPTSYGAVERIDTAEPPFYAVTDTVVVHTSQD